MNMKPIRFLGPLAAGVFLLTGSVLLAQNPAAPQSVKNACEADIQKFCVGIQHGRGRVYRCLKKNEASLEASCKAQLDAARARMKEAFKDCEDDVMKFCADVPKGKGRIQQCLKANEENLSMACRDRVQKAEDRKKPKK